MITYREPGGDVTITEREAIAIAHQAARADGHQYESDQAALDDFMVVHWADFIEPIMLI